MKLLNVMFAKGGTIDTARTFLLMCSVVWTFPVSVKLAQASSIRVHFKLFLSFIKYSY